MVTMIHRILVPLVLIGVAAFGRYTVASSSGGGVQFSEEALLPDGGVQFREETDPLTRGTRFVATSHFPNENNTLIAQIELSCESASGETLLTFTSLQGAPDAIGLLRPADGITRSNVQGRLGDWEASSIDLIGLLSGQPDTNVFAWDLARSLELYRFAYRFRTLMPEFPDQVLAEVNMAPIRWADATHLLNEYFFAADTTRRAEEDYRLSAVAEYLDSVKGLVSATSDPVVQYQYAKNWEFEGVPTTYPELESCEPCKHVIRSAAELDSLLRSWRVLENDPRVREYEELVDGRMEIWSAPAHMSAVIPLEALNTLEAFLDNRKELVIRYADTRGNNTAVVDLTNPMFKKVLTLCAAARN
jgi:hypothetical protein